MYGGAPAVVEVAAGEPGAELPASGEATESRLTGIIAHLRSLEVIDDELRQAVRRLLPRFLRQHRPEASQLDPLGGSAARGGYRLDRG
jgi:hypothetical protein